MKKIFFSKRMLSAVVLSFLFISMLSARDWFVKPNASGTGVSWDDACNISLIGGTPAGLADGDKVYVSAGIYQRSTSLRLCEIINCTIKK